MTFTYGILGGCAAGIINITGLIICSYYFDKKRAVATGIATAGAGIGESTFPFMIYLLMSKLEDWRSMLPFLAGIHLLSTAAALLVKPLNIVIGIDTSSITMDGKAKKNLNIFNWNFTTNLVPTCF